MLKALLESGVPLWFVSTVLLVALYEFERGWFYRHVEKPFEHLDGDLPQVRAVNLPASAPENDNARVVVVDPDVPAGPHDDTQPMSIERTRAGRRRAA